MLKQQKLLINIQYMSLQRSRVNVRIFFFYSRVGLYAKTTRVSNACSHKESEKMCILYFLFLKQLVFMQKQQELLEQQKIKMQEQHRMEKEIMENERLEQIKNKKDGEQSK